MILFILEAPSACPCLKGNFTLKRYLRGLKIGIKLKFPLYSFLILGFWLKDISPQSKNVVLLARSSGGKRNKFGRSFAGKRNNFGRRCRGKGTRLVVVHQGEGRNYSISLLLIIKLFGASLQTLHLTLICPNHREVGTGYSLFRRQTWHGCNTLLSGGGVGWGEQRYYGEQLYCTTIILQKSQNAKLSYHIAQCHITKVSHSKTVLLHNSHIRHLLSTKVSYCTTLILHKCHIVQKSYCRSLTL